MLRPAIILLGGLVATWNHRFLEAARSRQLAVLIVDGPDPRLHRARALAAAAGGDHPWNQVVEVAELRPDSQGRILDDCLAWAERYDVRGVCSLREEYVAAGGLVADLLGVPSPGRRATRVCRNKHLQRRYLSRWSPRSDLVLPGQRSEAVAGWQQFPAIVKPVGRLASSGVQLAHDADDLEALLTGYPEQEVLLLEQRVQGREYSVESLTRSGVDRYVEATEKITTEDVGSPYFVELGHTTPAPLSDDDRRRLLGVHADVLRRLAFDTGIAHGEYRIDENGRIWLTEIAVRPPGDAIVNLHALATGGSLEDAIVALAVGEDPVVPARATRWARQVFIPHRPGILQRLEISAPFDSCVTWFDEAAGHDLVPARTQPHEPPTLRCLIGLKPVGTRLPPLRESADRAATYVIDAASQDDLEQLDQAVRAAVHLEVTA